jgi:hypothetical protein
MSLTSSMALVSAFSPTIQCVIISLAYLNDFEPPLVSSDWTYQIGNISIYKINNFIFHGFDFWFIQNIDTVSLRLPVEKYFTSSRNLGLRFGNSIFWISSFLHVKNTWNFKNIKLFHPTQLQ